MKFIKQKINNSDIGVWLSVAAAVGYGLYYVYTTSFNQYYGLPKDFVELKLENLAFVIVLVVLTMSLLLVISELYKLTCRFIFETFPYLNGREKNIKKFLAIVFLFFFIIVSALYLFGLIGNLEMTSLIILIAIFWRIDKFSLMLTILVCILMRGFLSIQLGDYSVAEKEEYLIIDSKNDQKFVVINSFQDKFIIAPVYF
ncbi:hypothetical protein P4646_09535 [Peribacillus simplex]|uniref:hypothetical protein n=1 Tax=Peribacillus simplex TaxID=1478 RepID=UPI002E233D94|nr:hypothetical protein [Peribacillus simplex]MED4097072.1 hypothetical protein [Peribacillus simplex]